MAESFFLTINAGSSSLKFALFRAAKQPARILAGKFERIGLPEGQLELKDMIADKRNKCPFDALTHVACVPKLEEVLEQHAGVNAIRAVGHRIVHGGPRFTQPQPVTGELLEELRRIRSFDPDHLPAELALVK